MKNEIKVDGSKDRIDPKGFGLSVETEIQNGLTPETGSTEQDDYNEFITITSTPEEKED